MVGTSGAGDAEADASGAAAVVCSEEGGFEAVGVGFAAGGWGGALCPALQAQSRHPSGIESPL